MRIRLGPRRSSDEYDANKINFHLFNVFSAKYLVSLRNFFVLYETDFVSAIFHSLSTGLDNLIFVTTKIGYRIFPHSFFVYVSCHLLSIDCRVVICTMILTSRFSDLKLLVISAKSVSRLDYEYRFLPCHDLLTRIVGTWNQPIVNDP